MKVVIYSASAGGYDWCRPQAQQDIDVDWVFLTDHDIDHAEPWTVRPLPPWPGRHPRMVAKRPRMRPREHFPEHDVAIWIDANMVVHNPAFAREAIASMRHGMAIWRHPQRRCIYDEAAASLKLAPRKYGDQPILAQVEHYRAQGHPEKAGLYAAGTIAWDLHDDRIDALGAAWLAECDRWSYQDQLSLPYVARRMGIRPGRFPHRQIGARALRNPWLSIEPHRNEE